MRGVNRFFVAFVALTFLALASCEKRTVVVTSEEPLGVSALSQRCEDIIGFLRGPTFRCIAATAACPAPLDIAQANCNGQVCAEGLCNTGSCRGTNLQAADIEGSTVADAGESTFCPEETPKLCLYAIQARCTCGCTV